MLHKSAFTGHVNTFATDVIHQMIAKLVYRLRPAITTNPTTEGFSTLTLDTSAKAVHHSILYEILCTQNRRLL